MGRQDGIKQIRHKEVCVCRIGLMHVFYSTYFHYLLLFIIHMLLLHKLGDLFIYLSLSVICCISAELFYVCQTVGVLIGKPLPDEATTDDTASYVGLTEIGSSYEI